MKPQVDLFSFVFWRKLKTPKRHFEINWPLAPTTKASLQNWFRKKILDVHKYKITKRCVLSEKNTYMLKWFVVLYSLAMFRRSVQRILLPLSSSTKTNSRDIRIPGFPNSRDFRIPGFPDFQFPGMKSPFSSFTNTNFNRSQLQAARQYGKHKRQNQQFNACPKGQLISEWLFGVFNFPKKPTQKFDEFLP